MDSSARVNPRRDIPFASTQERCAALIRALGLEVAQTIDTDGRSRAFVARTDARSENPYKVYVRVFDVPRSVPARDVAEAIDYARKEGFKKTILVSGSGFDREAVTTARGTTVELIDGSKLHEMLKAHGPEERS